MSGECEKCNEHTMDCQCKAALHTRIINGEEFSKIANHVEFITGMNPGNDYINAFYDGYICCFNAIEKALEMDLDGMD